MNYFKSDDKVRFYTGLPSFEVLMVVYEHVAPFVTRRSPTLDSVGLNEASTQSVNAPFQDLAYRFLVSLSTVSRFFSAWIIVMDTRLSCFIRWPEREELWRTVEDNAKLCPSSTHLAEKSLLSLTVLRCS